MPISRTPVFISSDSTGTVGTAKRVHSAASTGTAEELRVQSVVITAKDANTSNVWLGGSGIATGSNGGLAPGDALPLGLKSGYIDLTELYFLVAVTGEGIDYYASYR